MNHCDQCCDTGYVHTGLECLKCFAIDAKRYRFLRTQDGHVDDDFMILDLESSDYYEPMANLCLDALDKRIDASIARRSKK